MSKQFPTSGEVKKFKNVRVFFGSNYFSEEHLTRLEIENYRLVQVHGNRIVTPTKPNPTADGHWTLDRNKALIIRTADCMPVFLTDDDTQLIMALHIGWRSLQKKILSGSLEIFRSKGIFPKKIHCWVGPHIQQRSYALPVDDINSILKTHKLSFAELEQGGQLVPSTRKLGQWNIDLQWILGQEVKKHGLKSFIKNSCNTFESLNHFSHRRYGFRNGLNYSFIIKT